MGPSLQTIQQYVQQGQAGQSLGKPGPCPAGLPVATFALLSQAFIMHLRLNQLNQQGEKNQLEALYKNVQQVLGPLKIKGKSTVTQLIKHSSLQFKCGVAVPMEERRTRWTTYSNLSLWFEQWEADLKELGFGAEDSTGKFVINQGQLHRIINVDETALSFNGAKGRCGGRPAVEFYDPSLQASHKRTSKSSVTITLIAGSSAAGEAIPPHFQFPTRAKGDNAQLDIQLLDYMKGIEGKFGCEQMITWQCTFGANERGGMNDEEFEKYVLTNLVRLYPDAADVKGRRVIMKVDSGPGRMNIELCLITVLD